MQRNFESESEQPWLAVIGRALAYLCLVEAEMRDENIATQAQFLDKLGLPKKEAARLLGTSEASLRELLRLALLKKKKNGPKKKKQQ